MIARAATIAVFCCLSAAAFGQALASELEARVVQLFGRHGHAVRTGLDSIGNGGGLQRGGDLRLIFTAESGEQQAVARATGPEDDHDARGNRGGHADEQQ